MLSYRLQVQYKCCICSHFIANAIILDLTRSDMYGIILLSIKLKEGAYEVFYEVYRL